MSTKKFIMRVEPKEDETGEGVQPTDPTPAEMLGYLNDLLIDHSKHEGLIGYRIMEVKEG